MLKRARRLGKAIYHYAKWARKDTGRRVGLAAVKDSLVTVEIVAVVPWGDEARTVGCDDSIDVDCELPAYSTVELPSPSLRRVPRNRRHVGFEKWVTTRVIPVEAADPAALIGGARTESSFSLVDVSK